MQRTEFNRKEESVGTQLKIASEMERKGEGSVDDNKVIGRPLKMLSINGTWADHQVERGEQSRVIPSHWSTASSRFDRSGSLDEPAEERLAIRPCACCSRLISQSA
jgi:hypothetical protein